MLKYKINIADALERKGFNTYKAKTTKTFKPGNTKKNKKRGYEHIPGKHQ